MLEIFIVINPLLSFILIGLGHHLQIKRNSKTNTLISLNFLVYIAIGLLTTNVIIAYWMFLNKFLLNGLFFEISGFSNWVHISILQIEWGLLYDSITIIMLVLINTVSLVVHIYSLNYMLHDPFRVRFISYLSLFTFFMIILVTASNFVQLFIGWEGVGLCSYLLINFWYTRIQANKAAIKAMLVNKVSDLFIILGIIMIYYLCGSLDYKIVFNMIPILVENILTYNYLIIACIALVIGGIGKSAQIGLHTWLADAMEGPTPVSALIHAATMVTAGVFLLARCSPILEFLPEVLHFVAFIGILTAFLGSFMALVQTDIKKIIAYSTCSQLGYMFFACGCSLYHLGLFHLLTHGFFKALLFLCAGSIIHFFKDEQDIRRMGGFLYLLPITYIMFLFANLSLAGFPFLAGYYSKEGILLSSIMYFSYFNYGTIMFWMGCFTALLTAVYSMRSIVIVFLSQVSVRSLFKNKTLFSIEQFSLDHLILLILYFGAIISGYLLMDPLIGVGSLFWGNSIHFGFSSYSLHSFVSEFLNYKVNLNINFDINDVLVLLQEPLELDVIINEYINYVEAITLYVEYMEVVEEYVNYIDVITLYIEYIDQVEQFVYCEEMNKLILKSVEGYASLANVLSTILKK